MYEVTKDVRRSTFDVRRSTFDIEYEYVYEYERSSRRRYLTFVATAFSNVRRDDEFSDFRIFGFSDFWIFGFSDFRIFGFCFFFDFESYRARMQRRGHGCSAEGTRDGRTTSQRIRTFVATALSNVRRDGVI